MPKRPKQSPLFTLERFTPNAVTAASAPARVLERQDLSPDQAAVFDAVIAWSRDSGRRQYLSLGGLAGTGKTTLVAALAAELGRNTTITYAAYTGRASSVLASKLVNAGVRGVYNTLHGLMYTPSVHSHGKVDPEEAAAKGLSVEDGRKTCDKGSDCEDEGKLVGWKKQPQIDAGLVVLDEASMVGESLWEDLLSYGVPVLAVGDHGQLPPVGAAITSLMLEPDLRLEKIHRQAEGNPILELAHFVRNGGMVRDFKAKDDRVRFGVKYHELVGDWKSRGLDPLTCATICYYNATRVSTNRKVRRLAGIGDDELVREGEVVICLKNAKPIFNGMRGMVLGSAPNEVQGGTFPCKVAFPDEKIAINATVNRHQFNQEKTFETPFAIPGAPRTWNEAGMMFDFGYAMTCHKAQGSQWQEVALMAEGNFQSEDYRRRWVYTAVTRSADRLYLTNG